METGTIVLCDSASLRMAAALEAAGHDVLGVSHAGGPWVAECSVSLMRSVVRDPVVLVAAGANAEQLPAVGWGRRAARRPVGGYVLIDPIGTPRHNGQGDGDWPDAPVIVLTRRTDEPGAASSDALDQASSAGTDGTNGGTDGDATGDARRQAAMQARLRGWTVVSYDEDPAAGLMEVLAR